MKREIKFRAWDKIEKKMVNLSFPPETAWFEKGYENEFELMQFTGLKGKNGKEIYESDLLKDKYNRISKVEWLGWGYNLIGISEKWKGCVLDFRPDNRDAEVNPEKCEVIGNIYENPGLLK